MIRGWAGYVYNIGVDEDESYVVNGVATHNCVCALTYLPRGWNFNHDWEIVPMGGVDG
jgi:hypothetical protein